MRASVLIALLLLAPVARSQDTGSAAGAVVAPREAIAACIKSASGDEEGLAALEAACPRIERALISSGYVDFISESESERLTVHGLVDLLDIAERYDPSPERAAGAQADLAKLNPILASLKNAEPIERPPTLWEKLKRWLGDLIRRGTEDEESWLGRWLQEVDFPQRAMSIILMVSIGLIVLAAIAVIVNELRAAGVFRRGSRRAVASAVAESRAEFARAPTLADLESAPVAERPALLLRVLVQTLVTTGRLRVEKSLTHSELGTRAAFDVPDHRQSFRQVAVLGERILYGNRTVGDDEVDAVVRVGRALDEQLRAAT